MARRTKRLWTDEEKRSICFQTTAPDISVAQVARRYAMNANLIFKWFRNPRFAPEADATPTIAPCFLPVGIVDDIPGGGTPPAGDAPKAGGIIEIDTAGGHRLRINGTYDPDALARLIRGLSG
ncbi:transposase [Seohaeicola saemankumensis]|uniref:IS66-like element accessory protein TnpA n=1 Tax=Seohaeicola saemankumensis TaxID=481181 RepID=UPI0035CFDC89